MSGVAIMQSDAPNTRHQVIVTGFNH